MTFTLSLAALFGCIVYSRILGERAMRELTAEQKVQLIDGFSSMRKYSVIPLGILLLAVLGLPKLFPEHRTSLSITGLVAFLIYMLLIQLIVAAKLRSLGLPDQYRKNFLLARTISLIGMALFFAGVAYEFLQRQYQ